MKMLIAVMIFACLLVAGAGCTSEQQSSIGDTLVMQQKISAHALTLKAVWENDAYDTPTKIQMTNDLTAQWMQDAELASAEDVGQTQQFVNFLITGISAAGGQLNSLSIGSLILAGVMTFLAKKKKT
ncbi:MAG: hypothetical protein ABII09_03700 [Planctomycetota bacterium]